DMEADALEEVEVAPTEHVPAEAAPRFRASGLPSLVSTTFFADRAGEGVLALRARGIGTDWAAAGRESAVVSVYLDGAHNHDLILLRGETMAEYRTLLGPIDRGEHRIEVRFRPDLSPAGALGAEVAAAAPEIKGSADPEYGAIAGAPIVYARPDAAFSDSPLFLTYERLATGYKYTMYVSNEDGGTPAADLMAVWGRACDIDWVYRQGGNGKGYIQAFLHRQVAYRGAFEGQHPILRVSTKNNMVSDQGASRFKLRLPVVAAPAGSREQALDQHPWVYRLTAAELAREGKIRAAGEREGLWSRLRGQQIGDMRRYVTIEFDHPGGDRIGFRARLAGSPAWFVSTGGRFYRAIKRSGAVRTSIELPPGASVAQLVALEPVTAGGKPYGKPVRILRAFGFDADYRQIPLPASLAPGAP
ncbi:MAG: hypothetical protein FJZ01_25765, partial [Candidatus Sericytochromatia bacterium]|nr:hypothetical protein [Candidatus Tanganyikabacteria bacterium]